MKKSDALFIVFLILCVGLAIVFGIPGIIPYSDEVIGALIADMVPRFSVAAYLIALMLKWGYADIFKAKWRASALVWSIPCLLVAVVNFPFSALIRGTATLERLDLLWLFLLKCVAIALLEEVFFRGLLFAFCMEQLPKKRGRMLFATLCSSAIFALMHLVNLFFGAGIGDTLLQVGYTFLIGCMLAVMLLRTKNIWLCVIIHTIFDVGGTIVTDLGSGAFQDMTFWILTAIAGMVCAIHVILTLLRLMKESE